MKILENMLNYTSSVALPIQYLLSVKKAATIITEIIVKFTFLPLSRNEK